MRFSRLGKYNAKPTEYNGVRYASKAEAQYAQVLDILLRSGQIIDWIGQPKVRLGAPDMTYRPDFLVIPKGERPYFVDVKGHETQRFRDIKKLWRCYARLQLRVVRKGTVIEYVVPNGGKEE